jgi:hypothetical protein
MTKRYWVFYLRKKATPSVFSHKKENIERVALNDEV